MRKTTLMAHGVLTEDDERSRQALALLVEHIAERVRRYLGKKIWDADAADDAFQETLLALAQSLQGGSYDPAYSFNAWMWLKARTAYAQWCRRREREAAALPAPEAPAASDPTAGLAAREVLQAMQARLAPECYDAFLLRYEAELGINEIAGLLGRDRKTIRQRIADAEACARALVGGGDDD